ncbi:MAG: PhzF family phenazine biosynthesis protein [Pseudomonadota bacterium]
MVHLQAFVGARDTLATARARGNPCLVARLSQAPTSLPGTASATQCLTWPLASRSAAVACFTAGAHRIQCCGHGLLSCAHLWLTDWDGQGTLFNGEAALPCEFRADRTWVGLPQLRTRPCEVPVWASAVLGCAVSGSAVAGADDGYLVLEVADTVSLQAVLPPTESLARHTARALIVTCQGSGEDIHYRYFAPQYGVPEDSATGSALRVLAPYWQHRGLPNCLAARQDSQAGGLLFSELRDGRCWIGGRIEEQPRAA